MEIREALKEDADRLLPLFLDMERFYEGENAIDAVMARERLSQALAANSHRIFLVAFDGNAIGFATLYEMFPGADMAGMWYLKELYVADSARGRSFGERLLRRAAQIVIAAGGTRIEFTTDAANSGGRKFYARLAATEVPKVFYRFEGEKLARLAAADQEVSVQP